MHINYISVILRHRAHCKLLYQLQLQSIHIYIQCQRHPTAYSIGILTATTLELKSWARFQLRSTLRWQYPELVVHRMHSPHNALLTPPQTPEPHPGLDPARVTHLHGGFRFQCGSQCRIIRPRMWSGTECGTQCGNAGVVRTHAIQPECNVRHGTGYVRTMCGSCAAQFSLSYIEYCHPTPTHVTYDGFGALYAFPLHAKQGDIFFVLPRPIRQDSIIGSYTCGSIPILQDLGPSLIDFRCFLR